jgi:hypothetical protein
MEEQVHAGPFAERLWKAITKLADHMNKQPE